MAAINEIVLSNEAAKNSIIESIENGFPFLLQILREMRMTG
jgi:hypothetical protein